MGIFRTKSKIVVIVKILTFVSISPAVQLSIIKNLSVHVLAQFFCARLLIVEDSIFHCKYPNQKQCQTVKTILILPALMPFLNRLLY
ncbi:hypothetical protein Zmor_020835 [Zophobas morio]|uniref:Uncharacterized protein n=1 Tax=Zophobas morio TaxID=2755281 RepID=A0AA38MA56_9CUCU|nr:hypothetical protein Zmor_020835 [Zophobas morio]